MLKWNVREQKSVNTDKSTDCYRKFIVAYLFRAVQDLKSKDTKIQEDARNFFFGNNKDEGYFLSFENCCQEIEINPNNVLKRLVQGNLEELDLRRLIRADR